MGGGGKKSTPSSKKKTSRKEEEGGASSSKSSSKSSPSPSDAPPSAPSSSATHPRETCPSFARGHLPADEQAARYRTLSAPHVDSFDYFLTTGLRAAVADIVPSELDVVDPRKKRDESAASQGDGDGAAAIASAGGSGRREDVDCVRFWIENARISFPSKTVFNTSGALGSSIRSGSSARLAPRECREMGLPYSGPMTADFCYQFVHRRADGTEIEGKVARTSKRFGEMPIMVMSRACHLRGKSPEELMRMKEEHNEFGGYFVVNGIERCVRLLQIPRRNHPTAIKRNNYKNRGPTYTDLGVAIRCARHNGDCSSITNTVHYLTTGGASLRFTARKQEFLIPVLLILRALSGGDGDGGEDDSSGGGGVTDEEIYSRIVRGDTTNTFLRARAELLLQDARRFSDLHTPLECLAYLGARFRMLSGRADSTPDVDIGRYMIDRYVLIHLPRNADKLECLLLLLRKLYSFAAGECGVDNADSLQNQEILLPGHLITHFVKEKLEESLQSVRLGLLKEMRVDFGRTYSNIKDARWWSRMVDRYAGIGSQGGIGKKVQHFLSTGNIISSSGLDLMQVSGYTIVAERLNFLRYCSHFRSVHRGQFFMEMKTTAVRKLLPDQWGFLCPVHTPDGGPCGLLSHLALKCEVLAKPAETAPVGGLRDLDELLIGLGVTPCGAGGRGGDGRSTPDKGHLPVCLDGRVVGGAPARLCKSISIKLRELKVSDPPTVPPTLEVAHIPPSADGGPYPGLYLFTGAARVVRPVLHRSTGRTEFIGPMEQPFMDIACLQEDIREGITTHMELDPTNMLSLIASLTPFSDYNQSPRNMYQCQMGKQTMGTPAHSLPYRPDNKLYRLQNPQAPVVQTARHGMFNMDEYPNGTNAVVAVLSYTGFDMEDAMILNKSSYERGFGHASVYKTMSVDLKDEAEHMGARGSSGDAARTPRLKFSNVPKGGKGRLRRRRFDGDDDDEEEEDASPWQYRTLDEDGLPIAGQWVSEGDPLYCVADALTGQSKVGKHKEKEKACVQCVRKLGGSQAQSASRARGGGGGVPDDKVSLTLRFPRNPVIGDKFSSRHGQKGVLSILWPQADMPFSESGISPDVIINPHAFPSRMTIGMLIESMAGKSGALHGMYQDATPFSFHESGDKIAVDYFGEQLQAAGYNYYGSEPLYSGVSGCIMHADLYIGVVYYQRLRHMVSDKYQVRATGQVNSLTRQPIKGRKKGGGIRLGEMERDSLLSHGAAFLLLDRLMNCSDRHVARACRRCGDLLGPATERSAVMSAGQSAADAANKARLRTYCRNPRCREAAERGAGGGGGSADECVEPIALPYVFRYLANELAGMNIKMTLDIK